MSVPRAVRVSCLTYDMSKVTHMNITNMNILHMYIFFDIIKLIYAYLSYSIGLVNTLSRIANYISDSRHGFDPNITWKGISK